MHLLSVLVVGGVLAGCNTGFAVRVDNNSSPYFRPGPEARVVMEQDVGIPPNQLRAFFQDGLPIDRRAVDPHYPNCNLELNTLASAGRTIPPGSYAITRTERVHAPLANLGSVQVAALGLTMWSGGSPTINFETRFFLEPVEGGSKDIRALNCSQWGEPGGITDYPTREEIAQTLGKIGHLDI